MTDRISATGAAAGAAPDPRTSIPNATTSPSGQTHALSAFWQQPAFSLGGIDFLHIDVALAAMVFGDWARFERRLTEGLSCAARAAAEGLSPSAHVIDEAAIAFRYESDLISGADMNAWLDRTGISSEAWMAFVTREVLRRMWSEEIEDCLDRYGPSPRQLEAAALAEGICSGLFDEFEHSFCGKAATAFDVDAALFRSRAHEAAADPDAAARLARQHAHWLAGRPSADTLTRLSVILEIRDLYCAASERVATEASLLDVIEDNRLEWVVIDTDTLSFTDENAAREAVLCVRQDELSLADVAGLSRHALIRTHGLLADLPPEHRHRVLAAEPGQVLGPLRVNGQFQVTTVIGRAMPTLAEREVARRARAVLLEQVARRAIRDHVR